MSGFRQHALEHDREAVGHVGPDVTAGIDAGGAPSASSGTVSRFGSIYVNGVRYRTDVALFLLNGAVGSESDLAIGQVVTVYGTVDDDGVSGTANVVVYESAVEGPISFIDGTTGRIQVLGQEIHVGPGTSISVQSGASSLAGLRENDAIAISGYVNAQGHIVATHISDLTGSEFELTGHVNTVDGAGYKLTINDLVVDYSAANLYGLAEGVPQPDERIEVVGNGMNAAGEFVATRIYVASPAVAAAGDLVVEIEGLVTRLEAPWDFEIDGVPVIGQWGTKFEGGWWFDVDLNAKIEVAGRFDDSGRLVADSISFEQEGDLSLAGRVEYVSGDAVVINGTAIRLRDDTEYEDDSDLQERRFGIDDLYAGDYVRLRVYRDSDGFVATRLERGDDDSAEDDREEDDD